MKITLDEATLSKAVINHLQAVGVQSDILKVEFRYTRVPYTVFAEVELAEAEARRPTKTRITVENAPLIADDVNKLAAALGSVVDPYNLPPLEDPVAEEPRPDAPAAPLFGGG